MYSADGEYVPFTSKVKCSGAVERWMSSIGKYLKLILIKPQLKLCFSFVEVIMRESLKYKLVYVLDALKKNLKTRDKWILKWPGQLCITAAQVCFIIHLIFEMLSVLPHCYVKIQWTAQCTVALLQSKHTGDSKPLKKLRSRQKKMLLKFSDAIRGDLAKIDRLKIVSLVTIEIHARDVVDHMYTSSM